MEKYVSALFISFYVYAFCGWIWESFVCPLLTGHPFKNSGFLLGPIVPIYGFGALTVSLLFSPMETHLSIFIEGGVVACVIEYLTSWAMETLYHRRWWDYSNRAFNVNGRVCLEGFLVFGLFSVVAVKYVQPILLKSIMNHGTTFLIVLATAFSTLMAIDFISTVIALTHLEERVDQVIKDLEEYARKAFDEFEQNKSSYTEIIELMKKNDLPKYQTMVHKAKFMEQRVLKAFPHLLKRRSK